MEDLQDAIEDAQYLSAVSSVEDGPRPVVPWEIPTEDQLSTWKSTITSRDLTGPPPFSMDWVLSRPLGMFLFSSYLKEVVGDYLEINFLEEVARWKAARGRLRADITGRIAANYLSPMILDSMAEERDESKNFLEGSIGCPVVENGTGTGLDSTKKLPPQMEINEYDLAISPITKFTAEKVQELRTECYNANTCKSVVGLCGPVLDKINKTVDQLKNTPEFRLKMNERDRVCSNRDAVTSKTSEMTGISSSIVETEKSSSEDSPARRNLSIMSKTLPEDMFDEASVIIVENIKEKHWKGFLESEQYKKLLNFLWFRDRPVVEEDFFLMRVLGRGGFGLVTGEV